MKSGDDDFNGDDQQNAIIATTTTPAGTTTATSVTAPSRGVWSIRSQSPTIDILSEVSRAPHSGAACSLSIESAREEKSLFLSAPSVAYSQRLPSDTRFFR